MATKNFCDWCGAEFTGWSDAWLRLKNMFNLYVWKFDLCNHCQNSVTEAIKAIEAQRREAKKDK